VLRSTSAEKQTRIKSDKAPVTTSNEDLVLRIPRRSAGYQGYQEAIATPCMNNALISSAWWLNPTPLKNDGVRHLGWLPLVN
jgi:hypothetical protein